MPIEIRMPVRIVGAAAGRITVSAVRRRESSSVRATLRKSGLTLETPKAVLINVGHNEHTKITKIDAAELSLITNSASGIHASGEIGLSTWMKGSSAAI